MTPDRKSPHPPGAALVALAGLVLAAVVAVGTPGAAGAEMGDKPCCRVADGQACCCCEDPASSPAGVASAPGRGSPRPARVEVGCIPASCRCRASAPAGPAPRSNAPDGLGRPAPAFDGPAREDPARIRRAAAPGSGSGSASPPISPLDLRTTPLLI